MNFYFKFLGKLVSEIVPFSINRKRTLKKRTFYAYIKRFVIKIIYITKIRKFFGKIKGFQMAYDLLEDSYSKNILIRIMVAHVYGFNNIHVSPKIHNVWKEKDNLYNKVKTNEIYSTNYFDFNLCDLNKIGIPIKLFDNVKGVFNSFLFKQYEYNHKKVIEACEGDIIIDAGGGLGNTALYFATKVKNTGRIYTFEFIGNNIKILIKNLSLNPVLKKFIELIKIPLWNTSDQELYIIEDGPNSMITFHSSEKSSEKIKTISIDDFVIRNNIPKVDFIKMDIEGAELDALLGAKETLARFKPKLAISVYHDLRHYYKIPQYINSLNLNYKFYLDHYSVRPSESILFAIIE